MTHQRPSAGAEGRFPRGDDPLSPTLSPSGGEGEAVPAPAGSGGVYLLGDVYLMASIGESLEARIAGYMPKVSASTSAATQAIRRPAGLTTRP
jgi:hypothetical protein